MTYAEAIQFLYRLQMFGANFGLSTTRRLAALIGNPQDKLRFIHVAGTNGKGSTCAMLESIYRTAGLRVGLFTSPHLVSFRERIQVNRQPIAESDVVRLVQLLRDAPDSHQASPTLFEFVTVMALKYFAEQNCDLVIWETGLGGRLDATNIVTPLASVITNIALDHQQWLGDTPAKIAAEKAGIIKPGVPVITSACQPEVLKVIEQVARENNAPFMRVESQVGSTLHLPPSLPGEHQKLNAALVIATVEVLKDQIPVGQESVRLGLKNVNWPGRLQLIQKSNGQKILLDGAHNIAGAEALRDSLKHDFTLTQPTLLLGVLGDKDWSPMCEILAPLAARIFTVRVASERSADAHALAAACRTANPSAEIFVCDSLPAALEKTAGDQSILIAGSLYLIGEALELLDPSFAGHGERGLNEWKTPPPARR